MGIVLLMGGLIEAQNPPGPWYEGLQKLWFTPPDWVFAPVWTTLYAMIGWVGARKLRRGGSGGLWILQMVLNFAWPPVFFGLQAPLFALGIVLWLLWSVVAFIRTEWRTDRLSAVLFVPYAAWVGLATTLNAGIVLLN